MIIYTVKIIEQLTQGGYANKECEDRIVVTDNFIAVLDGVTSRASQSKQSDKTGGVWAAEILSKALEELPATTSASAACVVFSSAISSALPETAFAHDVIPPGATALIFSAHRLEIWQIGSMPYMIDGYEYMTTDRYHETMVNARSILLELMLASGISEKELIEDAPDWKDLEPWLEKQHLLANNPNNRFSYGVINGSPIPEELVEIKQTRPNQEIVLASDGYPRLLPTLDASEAYREEVMRQDPLQIRSHPQWRAGGDDRAYIRFQI